MKTKTLVLFLTILFLSFPTGLSAERANSRISAVTVYRDRAIVTRTAATQFAAGEQVLSFENLPCGAAGSIPAGVRPWRSRSNHPRRQRANCFCRSDIRISRSKTWKLRSRICNDSAAFWMIAGKCWKSSAALCSACCSHPQRPVLLDQQAQRPGLRWMNGRSFSHTPRRLLARSTPNSRNSTWIANHCRLNRLRWNSSSISCAERGGGNRKPLPFV